MTLPKDVMEGNKLIAEFMGLKSFEDSRYGELWPDPLGSNTSQFNLKYHSSWDWLYPVIQKISGIVLNHECKTKKEMDNLIGIWNPIAGSLEYVADIEVVYHHVVQFIQWYKSLTPS